MRYIFDYFYWAPLLVLHVECDLNRKFHSRLARILVTHNEKL